MEFDRKTLLRTSASKLRTVREHLGYSRKEMVEYLRVNRTAYYKNENGDNLPGLSTLHRLSKDHDISMDWYYFDKGPMVFNEKGNAEQLRKKLEESKEKSGESERELEAFKNKAGELAKNIETMEKELEEERRKNLELNARVQAGADVKPEIAELLEHMAHIPLLYHEILGYFQRFKIENRELVETSMVEG